jgi:hypothetical protein
MRNIISGFAGKQGMMYLSKYRAAAVLCFAFLGSPYLSATPVFTFGGGSLTASVYIDLSTGNPQFDVRGSVYADVTDVADLGILNIADVTGGTDPLFLALPFGNGQLLAVDASTPSTGQFDSAMFDFMTPVVSGTVLTLQANVVGLPANVTPDPLLEDLIAGSPLYFSFAFTGQVPVGGGTLSTFVLSGVTATPTPSTPEPATFVLAGAALLLTSAFYRCRLRVRRIVA